MRRSAAGGARLKQPTGVRPAPAFIIVAAIVLIAFIIIAGWLVRSGTALSGLESAAADSGMTDDGFDSIFANAEARAIAQAADHSQLPSVLEDVEGITVDLIPLNEYSRPGVPLEGVNAIVIHYTANPGSTAQQNRNYFASLADSGETSASSHFVIGLEGEIIQCVPLDEKSYCSNNRNSDTISIECCHPDASGAFTDATMQSLIWLTRYLAEGYGLDSDGVIRHYDVTGKLCPLYFVEHEDEWESFKEAVFEK